ncbi:MAG: type VI secretion system baseplate subunit TssK [Desulfovibrio sp.]|jgi:type VI secretion system protein ImpJ|nr:type VI secretion system baseplate subunit TssK [Desulfovibrio sp.]
MLPERVMWTQGMGVSPVHMQQQDRYTDIQLRLRGEILRPHAWGFTEFAVDEQYLKLGKIILSKAKGIMPDGTLFSVENGQDVLVLDIDSGETNRVVTLTLPMSIQESLETRDEDTLGLSTRYVRTSRRMRDHNAYKERHSGDTVIMCGRLDLRLMFQEDSDLKGYITMPVARIVECKQDKTILLDRDFLPTFLHIEASPTLHGYLREVVGLLVHRAEHLAHRISNAGQTGTAELGDFMLLQCLNRMEPIFRHLESTSGVHPEEFYRVLLSLVGELSTFAERGKRPQEMIVYDHGEQYRSFAQLMESARFALSMVLEQHALLLPLQQRKNNIQLAPIHDKNLLGTALFVLVAQADMDQETLRGLLPKQIKIGTPENIRELVNTHLPGVKIQPMPVAPRQIPFHAGKSYFQLDFSSTQRAQLESSTGCAIHVSGSFPGLILQLWAIKE